MHVIHDSRKRDILPRYVSILEGKEKAKFLLAEENGVLNERISQVYEILEHCDLCERRCGANRNKGEKGFCRAPDEWRIFGAHIHMGEEPILIPSGTLFLAGCNMRCVYCQNAPASITPEAGEIWTNKEVAAWIDKISEVCRNVNFVTPDCYLKNIMETLKLVKKNIPVVWNSSAYYSEKTAYIIKDIVDVYLLDFRYFSDKCARRLSQAPGYPGAAKRNHMLAKKHGELIIRVLVIPGHIECDAKPVLKWIADHLGSDVYVNILSQYNPCYMAKKHPDINRPIEPEEYADIVDYARELGLSIL